MEFILILTFVLLVMLYVRTGRVRKKVDELFREQQRFGMRLDGLRDMMRGTAAGIAQAGEPAESQTQAAAKQPAVPVVPPTPELLPDRKVSAVPGRTVVEPVGPRVMRATEPVVVEERGKRERLLPPSAFVESVREILGRIWNWILVGEEFRTKGVTTEYAVATTWLLRLGILAIVMCAAYFLRWSIQRGLLGPEARVAISLLAGMAMLWGGVRILGKKYHVIGQGLLGGGLLVFYFSMYSMGPMYKIVTIPVAFALMVGVTAAAGVLAVRVDSLLVAVIGIAGGFLTPVLFRTPVPYLPGFYGYLLLLNAGILGIALYKQWRLLNYLGFVLTYALFAGSLDVYKGRPDFPVAMVFLSSFFVIQSAVVYLYNIVRKRSCSLLEILHLVLNAAIFAAFGYGLIHDAYGRPYPAIMSLALAVFYVLHVYAFLRRQYVDRNLLVALIALAGVFSTWTLPLVLEKESLTIALSLLAFVFLWLGDCMTSNFLRMAGHGVYAAVFYRLLVLDMPRNFDFHPAATLPMAAYWKAMSERLWTFGVSIGSIVAAFRLMLRRKSRSERLVAEANDTSMVLPESASNGIFYWMAVLLVFLFLHLELNTMFMYFMPLRMPVLTLLWCGMALYFFRQVAGGSSLHRVASWAMCVFLIGALLKVFVFDLAAWRFNDHFVYNMEYTLFLAAMRLLDFGFIIGALLLVWWWACAGSGGGVRPAVFGYTALLLLCLYATFEVNTLLFWKLRQFQKGGVSVLWALFAIGFIAGGIWKNIKPLRLVGLMLFAVVALKVFMVDLAAMPMIYRVVAFMVIGITLLLGSFAYIYSSRKFSTLA